MASARRGSLVESVAGEIEERGRRTLRVRADVSDRASLESLRDACLAHFGKIDILVSAAAVTKRVKSIDMDDADWRRIIDTNVTGTLHACQVFGAPMLERAIRPHHHHRVARLDGRLLRSRGLHGEQGGGRRPDARARR